MQRWARSWTPTTSPSALSRFSASAAQCVCASSHPEGNTVFNQLQIPTLIRELEAARTHVTEERLAVLGQSELDSAREAKWSPTVIHAIELRNQRTRAARCWLTWSGCWSWPSKRGAGRTPI